MNLLSSRKNLLFVIALLVVIGFLGYQYWPLRPAATELIESISIEMDPAIRQTFLQRIEVTKAAIDSQKAAGGKVDMPLYMNLATDYQMIGELKLAADVYRDYTTNVNTIDYVAWNNLGDVLEQMQDYLGAEQAYLKAIELLPDYEEYYRDYVYFLENHFAATRSEDIRQWLEQSVANAGQSSWSMISLAEWYLNSGDCDQALAHYKIASQINPDNTAIQDEYADARAQCAGK